MNRAERRRDEAEARAQMKANSMPPARPDRRPLYFDVGGSDRVQCYVCVQRGIGVTYRGKEAAMNDPANPPEGLPKGSMHTVCIHHLPDNAVIYSPMTNMHRNKSGDHTWEETPREDIPSGSR